MYDKRLQANYITAEELPSFDVKFKSKTAIFT